MTWIRTTSTDRCLCKPSQPCGERDTWCPLCRHLPPSHGCMAAVGAEIAGALADIDEAPGDMRVNGWSVVPGGDNEIMADSGMDWTPDWTI